MVKHSASAKFPDEQKTNPEWRSLPNTQSTSKYFHPHTGLFSGAWFCWVNMFHKTETHQLLVPEDESATDEDSNQWSSLDVAEVLVSPFCW